MSVERPRGRDEVRTALLDAANELFGRKGPDAMSVRDVAAHANVNHGLLHRYVGSKEQLLREVILDHAEKFREVFNGAEDPGVAVARMFDLLMERPAFTRIFAHLLLAGHGPKEFVSHEGGSNRLAAFIQEKRQDDDGSFDDAKLAAAISTVLTMGWSLFGPLILYAVDFNGRPEDARKAVGEALKRVIAVPIGE